jgi:hypothetical protein
MDARCESLLTQFILSWNVRDYIESRNITNSGDFCISGTGRGEYPIDAWKPFFIEIPANGHKKDIAGRSYHAFGIAMQATEWNPKRVAWLPIYSNCTRSSVSDFKIVVKNWADISIPDDVPCIALAVKCRGYYSDAQEAQHVAVLLVWNDGAARLVSLDWSQGSLEDCPTPEWYLEASKLMNVNACMGILDGMYRNIRLDDAVYSIFAIPPCICDGIGRAASPTAYRFWENEWRFLDYDSLEDNLSGVFSKIKNIYSDEKGGV